MLLPEVVMVTVHVVTFRLFGLVDSALHIRYS